MSSHTSIAGFTDFRETQLTETIEQSMSMFFDYVFTNAGGYTNIRLNNSDFRSNNKSVLSKVSDPNYSTGQVWEAYAKNFVYESGLSVGTPINISGVYKNNIFYPLSTSGQHAYTIDYDNGRVIFDSGTVGPVKLEYSHKILSVGTPRTSPFLLLMQNGREKIHSNNFITNSGDWLVLGGQRVQLPHIAIESVDGEKTPHELGSMSKRFETDVLCHVITSTDSQCTKFADVINNMMGQSLYLLDLDTITRSGTYPINYDGTKNTNGKNYKELVDTVEYRKFGTYVKDSQITTRTQLSSTLHHSVVRITLETIK